MSEHPTRSLSEALTKLAFNDEVPAPTLADALHNGRWGCDPNDGLKQLIDALQFLCNAAYRKEIDIWGRSASGLLTDSPEQGPLRKLTQAECLSFRLFVPGYDVLWEGQNQDREYSDAFVALTRSAWLCNVSVDAADLASLLAEYRQPSSKASASFKLKVSSAGVGEAGHEAKPRLSERSLNRWWNGLSDANRDLPRDDLHKLCMSAHPEHSIARQRVRDLAPKRKPGPRPIAPKSSA